MLTELLCIGALIIFVGVMGLLFEIGVRRLFG